MTAKELREKRAKLIADARKYHEENKADWTTDRQAAFDKMIDDAQKMIAEARSIEALEGAEKGLAEQAPPVVTAPAKPGDQTPAAERVLTRQGRDPITGRVRYGEVPAGRRGTAEYRRAFSASLLGALPPDAPRQHAQRRRRKGRLLGRLGAIRGRVAQGSR